MTNSNPSPDGNAADHLRDGDVPLEDITRARHAVAQAEQAVDTLLAKLERAPRARKVTVSAPLEAALHRLQDARVILDRLSDEI